MPPKFNPHKIKVIYIPEVHQWGMKLTIQNEQTQIEVVSSASALIIRALKKLPRNRKKQKHIKHSENITFDEIVNIAQ
ncbi:60s ribosomal protein l12 [Lynx pardinus]|uniref:60s ribosomal protein l12 n=1 Tax=Lynx pardinus TaxID=191816 RepID=A0A485MP02_LYNPA|nr:60s ribosomal protein l12 [Lynx pardinus]